MLQVEQAQIHAGRVKALFVTHLHGDHCFGIPGLLRSVSSAREGTPLASEAFRIFGPPGLRALVTSALAFDATPLCMPIVSLCDDCPVTIQNACCSILTAVAPHRYMAVWESRRRQAMSAKSDRFITEMLLCFLTSPHRHLVQRHGIKWVHMQGCVNSVNALVGLFCSYWILTYLRRRLSQSGQ